MDNFALARLVAMVSGLLVLTVVASLGALHGYRLAEVLAVMALGASVVSWVLGLAAFGYYVVGR